MFMHIYDWVGFRVGGFMEETKMTCTCNLEI